MADISKCSNGCERQDKCYRWTAPVDPLWQTYADFAPGEDGECENFWDNTGRLDNANR